MLESKLFGGVGMRLAKSQLLGIIFLSIMLGLALVYISGRQHQVRINTLNATIASLEQRFQQQLDLSARKTEEYTTEIARLNSQLANMQISKRDLNKRIKTTAKNSDQKIETAKKLQLQLADLNDKISHKYENFLDQKETFGLLSTECKKSRSNSDTCYNLELTKETIQGLELQLNFLQSRRAQLTQEIFKTLS